MPSVTRRTRPRRDDRRAALERRLLAATERLMADGLAFTEVSVDRLATEAGISRATFYVYFADKGHLLRLLARRVLTEPVAVAEARWNAPVRDADGLLAGMREIIAVFRTHQQLLTAIVETAGYDAGVAEEYREMHEGIAARFRAVIERDQTAGRIRPLPAAETAAALTWMVERTCHQTLREAPPEADDRLARALSELVWGALYLRPLDDRP